MNFWIRHLVGGLIFKVQRVQLGVYIKYGTVEAAFLPLERVGTDRNLQADSQEEVNLRATAPIKSRQQAAQLFRSRALQIRRAADPLRVRAYGFPSFQSHVFCSKPYRIFSERLQIVSINPGN